MRWPLLALILLPIDLALAHEIENEILEIDFRILIFATVAIAILLLIGVSRQKSLKVKHEKIIFILLSVVVLSVTMYLAGITIYWNVSSESNGPVHWHADLEIEICGEKIVLPHSAGLQGKVGTELLHHHNDMRIHIEGIIIKLTKVDVQHFFQAIGGDLTAVSISVPQALPPDSNPRAYKNGDYCPDGKAGTLRVFVNDKKIENPHKYVIAPYGKIPPGDKIKIIFDSENGI